MPSVTPDYMIEEDIMEDGLHKVVLRITSTKTITTVLAGVDTTTLAAGSLARKVGVSDIYELDNDRETWVKWGE